MPKSLITKLAFQQQTIDKIMARLCPEQVALVNDESRLIAARCSRRCGKTEAVTTRFIKLCLEKSNANCLYCALTRESARSLMIKNLLRFRRNFKLDFKYKQSSLEVNFPNGSRIFVLGLDASSTEVDKALGQFYDLVALDECASFRQDLDEIVYSMLGPATIDVKGTIMLLGTPQSFCGNLFKRITVNTGKVQDPTNGREWNVHHWTGYNNPAVQDNFKEEIEGFKRGNMNFELTPFFWHQYKGEWFRDLTAQVYKLHQDNLNHVIPFEEFINHKDLYHFFFGIDLGFNDSTALTVIACKPQDRTIWVPYSQKRPKQIASRIADWIREINALFPAVRMVMDDGGLGKMILEDLRQNMNLPLEIAEKQNKNTAIELVNNDLINRHIYFISDVTKDRQGHSQDLTDEMENLLWDKRFMSLQGKYREMAGMPNDACDSFLYAFRAAKHFYAEEPDINPDKLTKTNIEEWMVRQIIAQSAQEREDRQTPWSLDDRSFKWLENEDRDDRDDWPPEVVQEV